MNAVSMSAIIPRCLIGMTIFARVIDCQDLVRTKFPRNPRPFPSISAVPFQIGFAEERCALRSRRSDERDIFRPYFLPKGLRGCAYVQWCIADEKAHKLFTTSSTLVLTSGRLYIREAS